MVDELVKQAVTALNPEHKFKEAEDQVGTTVGNGKTSSIRDLWSLVPP